MTTWMLRAGEYGALIESFIQENCVTLGWDDFGDLSSLSPEDIEAKYRDCYPEDGPHRAGQALGMLNKFIFSLKKEDRVISYDPSRRVYHVGFVTGGYRFDQTHAALYGHRLPISWEREVDRDLLSTAAKSSLGSALTLFQLSEEVAEELNQVLSQPKDVAVKPESIEQAAFVIEQEYQNVASKARDFIKDKINALSSESMEHLVAGVLRAMNFKTRVSPKGRDRGLDVLASPDGLGLQNPTIKVQVKHTSGKTGAPDLRNFMSILRHQERGLFVSTGGFTQEAIFEGERAATPVSMIETEALLDLIIEHYDNFDASTQRLLPLTKTYWPQ